MKMELSQKLIVLLAVITAILINGGESIKNDLLESEALKNRCGGPVEADSGSLIFSRDEQDLEDGEICVWTIHLQTKTTFRLNFSALDVASNDANCEDGAVRVYSLTNLIPSDRAEGYEFCNSKPPNGAYYLSESLITVIYQSSSSSPNSSSSGSGFTLNWEGISIQPIPKNHESSFSSSAGGIIRYPISGPYPPSHISTWLIKTAQNSPPDSQLHLSFPYVTLEACDTAPIDSCFCDALILYRITNNGILQEHSRLCGNRSDIEIDDIGQNFVLALFTDHLSNANGTGVGFELQYRSYVPTTTTEPTPPTTEAPPANASYACGGVLGGTQGLISYKLDETYKMDELCIWTIRTPLRKQIRFTMIRSGIESFNDYVGLYTFNSSGLEQREIFQRPVSSPQSILMNGTVAIVVFRSDFATIGQGFLLHYESVGEVNTDIKYYSDYTLEGSSDSEDIQTFNYPETGFYNNLELSTFVFTKPNGVSGLDQRVLMNVTEVDLEYSEEEQRCLDALHIFRVPTWSYTWPIRPELSTFTPAGGHCQGDLKVRYAEAVILVLATDSRERREGFTLNYSISGGFD